MTEPLILEVSIPSATKCCSHTEYIVNLITNNAHFEKSYIRVHRRYSQFLELHNKLRPHIPALPAFPRKSVFSRFRKHVIEARRVSFEEYIRYACQFVVRNGFEQEAFGRELLQFFNK